MKFIKAIPRVGGLREIVVFYCARCKQAETEVQKEDVAGSARGISISGTEGRPGREFC
jgi:hypothetical protein